MRTALLFAFVLMGSTALFAQNDTYKYHFKGNLNEMYAKGPALTQQCTGTYATESLPVGVSKQTYRFDKGCGIVYNDATKNFITSGTYTIEMYFKLDTITGYKKLIDFDSMKVDGGIYNQNGRIVLYPSFSSLDSFIGPNVYQYLVVTRDAATKMMYINVNGRSAGTYNDVAGLFKLGTDKLLTFFRDDQTTSGEHSGGKVAMIQLSNYVKDSATVKSNYALLNHTLSIPAIGTASEILLYPNPAVGFISAIVPTNCTYIISDLAGRTITTGLLAQGDNKIQLDGLANGLHLIKITGTDGGGNLVYRFYKTDQY